MVINIMNTPFVLEMFDIEHRLFGCEQLLVLDILRIPFISDLDINLDALL